MDLRWLAPTVVLAMIAIGLVMSSLMKSALYPAPAVPVDEAPAPLEEVRLTRPNGDSVVAWHWQASPDVPDAPLVIFFHGNGENLQTVLYSGVFERLHALGVSTLGVDYPGYGRSEGEASERSLIESAEAALVWAREERPAAPKIVMGWSLGAAVAVQLAAEHSEEVAGLLLLSPWTSLAAVAREHYPGWMVSLFLHETYDSLAAAETVRCPVLVIHGIQDSIIPVEQGKAVAEALEAGWVAVADAGHNDLLNRDEVWREMASTLQRWRGR